jgi:hypothetical protein
MQGATVAHLGSQLDFTPAGLTFQQFHGFFDEALAAAKKVEPIVEAGNKYSVDKNFPNLNGQLLKYEIQTSAVYAALSAGDKARADQFFEVMCMNNELRNRNPLHPNPLDSVVIGNLLNFPKVRPRGTTMPFASRHHCALTWCLRLCSTSSASPLPVIPPTATSRCPAVSSRTASR